MTHGLGFNSNLLSYKVQHGRKLDYLAPCLTENRGPTTKFVPISVFDSMIHGSESFSVLNKDLLSIGELNMDYNSFIREVESNPKVLSAATKFYNNADSSNLQMVLPDGTRILLSSNENEQGTYQSGWSISHLHFSMASTMDFLMTPESGSGETLNSILSFLGTDSIYGPKTLKILSVLGYSTPQKMRLLNLTNVSYD